MSAPYAVCGCTEQIATEAAAQRHAKECDLMGMPANPTTCRVTVFTEGRGRNHPCGEPAVAGALCAEHYADKRANGRGNR